MAPSHHLPLEVWEAFTSLALAADTWLGLQVADSSAYKGDPPNILRSQREGLCSADRLPGQEKCLSFLFLPLLEARERAQQAC